jgi:hypothetical protein
LQKGVLFEFFSGGAWNSEILDAKPQDVFAKPLVPYGTPWPKRGKNENPPHLPISSQA